MTSLPRRGFAVLATLLLVVGCVPPPAGRPSATTTETTVGPTMSAVPSPSGPTPLPSFVRPTPTPLPTFLAYVVQQGDTLSSIARRFATTPFSIAYWNRTAHPSLDPDSDSYQPDRIGIGWTLLLIPNAAIDGSDLPEDSPTPTVLPSAGATSSIPSGTDPSPSTGGVSVVVRHGPRSVATVALTFDMGGRLEPALDIVGWLVDNGVPATVFPTGDTGTTTTVGRLALEQVAGHPGLFDFGNHSWSHPDFRDLDDPAIRDQLERTESAILATVNRSTKPWFRPPFGGLDDQIPAVVGSAGWSYTVLWDVDTIDWRPEVDGGPTAADIVDEGGRECPGRVHRAHAPRRVQYVRGAARHRRGPAGEGPGAGDARRDVRVVGGYPARVSADPSAPRIVVTVAVASRQAEPAIAARKNRLYADAVERHGAEPVVLDATSTPEERREAFATMAGLLISGGADIDPARYGQPVDGALGTEPDRDALEAEAWVVARDLGRPVLGLCRGLQAINVFSGGSLLQHVDGHAGAAYGHGPAATHPIRLEPASRLAAAIGGAGELTVNSYHHQGIRPTDLAPGLVPSAWADSPGGPLVEGLESADGRFVVGIQCHPERTESTPDGFERLFAAFVDACRSPRVDPPG